MQRLLRFSTAAVAPSKRVRHIPAQMQFTCEGETTPGNATALLGFLEYNIQGTTMDMWRTFVDPAGRGQGIAKLLCDEAFEYAKTNELEVVPSCSYIRHTYLKPSPTKRKAP
ncbi:hypothetical protein H257_13410 [Aphanomyces astaci]|uniref:N-acetyltransferase domain-containing protein n=1 Tax=Aphanomyces astaci TaxID=112090 RepID=W4FUV0_APHAT|nr:hypothetical protein H257_13410 [Aphanomyces astaci]ETV71272.1 hypothetical protein H257_13410 [Aphanomyces astaci]|eukprot:XP_009839212.1 hypothetical protein H257_13410 [Aphanomyces astaci]